jgi:hypothetical protein
MKQKTTSRIELGLKNVLDKPPEEKTFVLFWLSKNGKQIANKRRLAGYFEIWLKKIFSLAAKEDM